MGYLSNPHVPQGRAWCILNLTFSNWVMDSLRDMRTEHDLICFYIICSEKEG